MPYREDLGKIRESYNTKHLKAEQEADVKRAELWRKIDGLKEIDRKLAATGPRLMAVALHESDETVDAIHSDVDALNERRALLLEANGYPPDYSDPHYDCNICGDSGYVNGKMCECLRRELILAGYESSGITKLMRTQTFDNFDLDYYRANERVYMNMKYVFNTMKGYAENFLPKSSPNLALFGGTGLGKTHLSSAVARVVIEKGWDVVYTGAIGMLSDFELYRFDDSSGIESGFARERYMNCDLLIIDDLGTEVSNQFTLSCLYNVINTRGIFERPTIISTNLLQNEFMERYNERITSRVIGEYLPLVFTGSDVRKQKVIKG